MMQLARDTSLIYSFVLKTVSHAIDFFKGPLTFFPINKYEFYFLSKLFVTVQYGRH